MEIPQLPDDIMKMIMNFNKERERDELFKKRYDIVVKQMTAYFEEVEDGSDEIILVESMFLDGGDIDLDSWFIYHNNLQNTSYYKQTCDWYNVNKLMNPLPDNDYRNDFEESSDEE